MNRRLILAAVAGAAVVGTVAPSFAASPVDVTVTKQDGGVYVTTTFDGRPLVAAGNTDQGICVGVSLQVPQCVRVAIQRPSQPQSDTRQSLPVGPVVVYHDDTRTAVGVGDVGVVVYSDGEICPVVSTQDWPCVRTSLS